jgi:RNA polymerase sigma-70 factor (ECF subfamily)
MEYSATTTWAAITTDTDLVARAAAGEGICFDQLVERYHRQIANFVFRMVGNYETALDLTQEVFIKVYSSLGRYNPEFKFSTWIYKIASNTAIDYLRKQSVTVSPLYMVSGDDEEFELPIPAKGPSPERALERTERSAQIEEAISKLPPRYRELIVLRHVSEFSYDEIAEVTGLPLGTVKNRIFRAREAMRKHLIRMGIEGVD